MSGNRGTLDWQKSEQYTTGLAPKVSINKNNYVIEAHSDQAKKKLYCGVCQVSSNGKDFSTKQLGDDGDHYAEGEQPSLAINDSNIVVEIHCKDNTLYTMTGVFDEKSAKVSWGTPVRYNPGRAPSIAINNIGGHNLVVETHQSHDKNDLYFNIGIIENSAAGLSIKWQHSSAPSLGKNNRGQTPSVAIRGNVVVAAFRASSGNKLYYLFGVIGTTGIVWNDTPVNYDTGRNNSIAISEIGNVIEFHQSSSSNQLWYHTGQLDLKNKQLELSAPNKFEAGRDPAVAYTKITAIQVHKSGNHNTLWASTAPTATVPGPQFHFDLNMPISF